MCLKLKNGEKAKLEVADAPIICYKVLRNRNGDYFSPFYDFEYVVGEEFYDINPIEAIDSNMALYGFHTYERLDDAERLRDMLNRDSNWDTYVVSSCTIPIGARYYSGIVVTGYVEEVSKNGSLPPGYVSSRIVINKIIG